MNDIPPDVDANVEPVVSLGNPIKRATIVDQEDDTFGVEYDNTIGSRNTMRLEATTYEDALLEAKSFLGIDEDRDEHGTVWEID